jgi:hypothetical protein
MTFIPVDAQTSLVKTQQIFQNTFGSGYNINPVSLNGVFIQELANQNFKVNSIQTLLYGGLYNPNVASGEYLDSICALLSLKRVPAIASFATCQVTGLAGTVIPLGAQILNTNGDVFTLTSAPITITGNPLVDVGVFTSTALGIATPVGAGTLNRIVQQIAGWDTVNNPTNGIVGKPAQTDTSLRYTRTEALAINSTGTINAIISGAFMLIIPNIISDFIVLQNPTATDATINGVTVPAYGIYLSVVQIGSDNNISGLLYYKKPPGSVMGGNYTPPLYIDPDYSWNTFQAKYTQATVEQVVIAIDITNVNYPAGTASKIANAILDAFNNGTAANPPITMRSGTIYASQFISSVVLLGVTTINSITITTETLATPAATLTLPADQAPQLQLSNVLITGVD